MTIDKRDFEHVDLFIGDIVKEKDWITLFDEPLYGIVVAVVKDAYIDIDWLAGVDKIQVYWFKWRDTEFLPSNYLQIVSEINLDFEE
tara:strand:+ start:215 stop:475 length:261 start_codon:yes stop_codon:yes gene_type:complete